MAFLGKIRRFPLKRILFLGFMLVAQTSPAARCPEIYHHLAHPPLVLQTTDHTCGAACAVSILKQLTGEDLAEMVVAKILGTTAEIGTTPEQMAKGLKYFGLKTSLSRGVTLQKLKQNFRRGRGQLLLVQSGDSAHWVVLVDYANDQVRVMDPWMENAGYLTYAEREFLRIWDTSILGKRERRVSVVVR